MSVTLTSEITKPQALTVEDIDCWRQLLRKSPSLQSAFLSYAYSAAAEQAFRTVYVANLRVGGTTVGFFPFQYRSAIYRRLGWGERVSGELADSFGIVAEPWLRLSGPTLLKLGRLTALYFTHLSEAQTHYGLMGEKPEIGLRIEFPNGGRQYWEALRLIDGQFVSDTERRGRKIAEKFGPLQFVFRQQSPAAHLEHLISAKRAQYGRTGVPDGLARPVTREFLHILAQCEDSDCSGVLSTLHSGNCWVASHFGLMHKTTLHYWFPVYNPALHAYSPGRLLLKAIIDASPEIGLQAIDRGTGDSSAKRDFANSERKYLRGVWTRSGIRSTMFRANLSASWRVNAIKSALSKD